MQGHCKGVWRLYISLLVLSWRFRPKGLAYASPATGRWQEYHQKAMLRCQAPLQCRVEEAVVFAVLRQVEAKLFVMLVDAQRRNEVHQLVKQPRAAERERSEEHTSREVGKQQSRASGRDQTAVGREHGCQDHAGDATHAMARKDVKRIVDGDRKSTRLNSSHSQISYAVFCLKKKNKTAP